MYLFTFMAVPTPDAKEFHEAGGAYVNCWIQSDDRGDRGDRDAAEERAKELIEEYGWAVEALEEGAIVSGEDYPPGEEDREFYEQALIEREVLVFNTWPRGEDAGEID
jgi:hypothetical protein